MFTWVWDFDPEHELLVTIDFIKLEDRKTKIKISQRGFPNTESRDNHRVGWTGGLSNLAKLLK